MTAHEGTLLDRILRWLRAGYPGGVPREDYVVLLGVLKRHLTEQEVNDIAGGLAEAAQGTGVTVTRQSIIDGISSATLAKADPADIMRVTERLMAGGWPVEELPHGGAR